MDRIDDAPRPHRRSRRAFLAAAALALAALLGWLLASDGKQVSAAPGAKEDASEVVARIHGEAVTRAEVEAAAADELEKLEMQRLQAEAQYKRGRRDAIASALDKVVEDRLLAMEGDAKGMPADQLVSEALAAKGLEITAEEIDAFYTQLGQRRPGQQLPPKEQIEGQIRTYLTQQKEQQARQELISELGERYGVERLLPDAREQVASEGFPARGPASAPVTIVEFSDFQCPFCARVVPTLKKVEETYGDKVRIVFRQFPLTSIHPQAAKAAEASLCAEEQGKFWEMHDAMFADQKALAVDDLKSTAARLGMDAETFGACLDSARFADQVQTDLRAGAVAGVSGTPALFINGRFLSGAQPFEEFAMIIDEELARSGSSS